MEHDGKYLDFAYFSIREVIISKYSLPTELDIIMPR